MALTASGIETLSKLLKVKQWDQLLEEALENLRDPLAWQRKWDERERVGYNLTSKH